VSRALVAIVVVALAGWLGLTVGACVRPPGCHCPPLVPVATGHFRAVHASDPALEGADVQVTHDRVVITYFDRGSVQRIELEVVGRSPEEP
jgi:hypothetical protein